MRTRLLLTVVSPLLTVGFPLLSFLDFVKTVTRRRRLGGSYFLTYVSGSKNSAMARFLDSGSDSNTSAFLGPQLAWHLQMPRE